MITRKGTFIVHSTSTGTSFVRLSCKLFLEEVVHARVVFFLVLFSFAGCNGNNAWSLKWVRGKGKPTLTM